MIPKEMKCPICGGKLHPQGVSRAINERCLYSDMQASVRFFSCDTCGRDIDCTDPREEDRNDTYKEYWDSHQDELYSED